MKKLPTHWLGLEAVLLHTTMVGSTTFLSLIQIRRSFSSRHSLWTVFSLRRKDEKPSNSTKKTCLPYEEATYTLAGIGSSPTTYNNGRIYNIPLLDSNQEIIFVKAFSVETILSEKIGQEAVNFNKEDFPHYQKSSTRSRKTFGKEAPGYPNRQP